MNPPRSLLILVGAVAAFVVTQLFVSAILGDLTSRLLELELTFSDDGFAGSVIWLKWALALGVLGFLIWRLPRAVLRSRVSATPWGHVC